VKRRGSRLESIVAKLYRKGGYSVDKHVIRIKRGKRIELDVVARRPREVRVIEVKSGRQALSSSDIRQLAKKGVNTLAIGPRVSLTTPALRELTKQGIKLKRIVF